VSKAPENINNAPQGRRETMYKSNSGFAPHRRQGGFIQGAILFALVIIAVVVAAFSLASQDNQTNADSEEARVNATYVLKVGTDIGSAVNRAIADGVSPAVANTQITFTNASDSIAVGLWDPQLRYLSAEPRFPDAALAVSGVDPVYSWVAPVALAGIGAAGVEQVVQIDGIATAVCQRVNNIVNGLVVSAPLPGTLPAAAAVDGVSWREGCIAGVDAGTYFRVVVVDAATSDG
jgi:hypothetical protein